MRTMSVQDAARADAEAAIAALAYDEEDASWTALLFSGPVWAVAGFLCGAVFWHMVGFWDFVGGLVHRGPTGSQRLEAAMTAGTACTTLALDRTSGLTRAEPCPAMIAVLPESRRNYRGSLTIEARYRLTQPERWSITVSDAVEAEGEGAVRKAD